MDRFPSERAFEYITALPFGWEYVLIGCGMQCLRLYFIRASFEAQNFVIVHRQKRRVGSRLLGELAL